MIFVAVTMNAFNVFEFAHFMTGNPNQQRKPFDAAPYASLRTAEAGIEETKDAKPAERAKDIAAQEFAAEAEKLRRLREALFAAFEAGADAGLPNTLIDLTIAYTNALRLQLNLRSVSARQFLPSHKVSTGPKAHETDKR